MTNPKNFICKLTTIGTYKNIILIFQNLKYFKSGYRTCRMAARASANRDVQLLVRWHHEWWNGSGYPDALRQNEIPLAARILRVADSYAALTDARPYRPALTEEEARNQIVERAAIEFDPAVVAVLLAHEDLDELRSFAQPMEALAGSGATKNDEWNLFSSFMR
jgi:HD-GYP domain-containing protein (c-di-GMP phosphodiesterase class II)